MGREISRALLSDITPKRLWGRRRLDQDFVLEIQEWLFRAGWALFDAGPTYAIISTKTVEGWNRLTSKTLGSTLRTVQAGQRDFSPHYSVFANDDQDEDD